MNGNNSRALGLERWRPVNVSSSTGGRTKITKRCGLAIKARAIPIALPEDQTKVAIFVEPSPFSHVSGMRIRFTNLIKGLRELGNDVTVVTPCIAPPKEFCGAKVIIIAQFASDAKLGPNCLICSMSRRQEGRADMAILSCNSLWKGCLAKDPWSFSNID